MTYQEILANARTCMGPYCKSCPVCNGVACKNTVPGPGAKGIGTGFIRNYQKWQELCVNMDTICENVPVDTSYNFFGNCRRNYSWCPRARSRRWCPCSRTAPATSDSCG